MKKLMAYVLSFGLVLLGMSPVLAAGVDNNVENNLQSRVNIPRTQTIPDKDLQNVVGKQLDEAVGYAIGALVGAGVGVAENAAENYVDGKPLLHDAGTSAIIGAITGADVVTKEVVTASRYASGIIEVTVRNVIDGRRTIRAAGKSIAANVGIRLYERYHNSGTSRGNGHGVSRGRFSIGGSAGSGIGSRGGSGW